MLMTVNEASLIFGNLTIEQWLHSLEESMLAENFMDTKDAFGLLRVIFVLFCHRLVPGHVRIIDVPGSDERHNIAMCRGLVPSRQQ
jgi:hypothetical protein